MERQNPGMVRFMDRLNEKWNSWTKRSRTRRQKPVRITSPFRVTRGRGVQGVLPVQMFQGLETEGKGIGQSGKSVGVSEKEAECLPGHIAQAGHRRPQYKPDGEHGAHAAARMRPAARGGLRAFHPDAYRHATAAGDAAGYPDTQGKGKPEGAKTIAFPSPDEYGNKEK